MGAAVVGEAVMVGEAAVTDLEGEVEDTLLSVVVVTDSVVVTHLADSPAVLDSAGRGDFPLADFLVAEITAALVTVVSVDAIATFGTVAFAILMGTLSISASMGSDIRITTRTTTPMTMHIPITTTILIKASIILGTTERLDQVT
jgi:hypothetical protein